MEQEFFSLDFIENNAELLVEVVGDYPEQKLLTGEHNPDQLRVIKSQGRKAHEIVRLQDPCNFLISSDLKLELELAKLSGWKHYKIQTDDFDSSYFGFQCFGRCGAPERPKEAGFVTGFNFDLRTWDQSDFFIPESTLMIICTEKARNLLKERKIKNIELISLKELQWYSV